MTAIMDSNVAAEATQEPASQESLVPHPLETLDDQYNQIRSEINKYNTVASSRGDRGA